LKPRELREEDVGMISTASDRITVAMESPGGRERQSRSLP
jgi:hypothetical protein